MTGAAEDRLGFYPRTSHFECFLFFFKDDSTKTHGSSFSVGSCQLVIHKETMDLTKPEQRLVLAALAGKTC